ncbi:MAG: ectonucleotide pyrophosphatase/phosphodiesterase [Pseudobacter sp.]|uniref:alkaline phosphatase family protein n=1 Tax=Pseudobacter sp. TaxID=2045420 RepID=UPI003F7E4FF7
MRNYLKRGGYVLILLSLMQPATSQALKTRQKTEQQVMPGRANSPAQYDKPYVILISADGFRYDYIDKYNCVNLKKLSAGGVRAESMLPVYPSLTFPNHYSIVTGMYPAHHGLVDNTFYDPALQRRYSISNVKEVTDSIWYGGDPLWVLAEQQQLLSAVFYWVGSEAPVQGIRPSYWYHYGKDIQMPDRLQAVKDWLTLPEEKRPHFIAFYFPEVDHESHEHGPDSPETEEAVHFVDQSVGQLQRILDSLKLPVNLIFVSDHGMAAVDTVNTIKTPVVDTTKFVMTMGDMTAHIYAREKDEAAVNALYQQLKTAADGYDVYLLSETPERWHYRKEDDRFGRLGEILLVPQYPRVFHWGNRRVIPGRHGYDPYKHKDMHASFYAWGPQIHSGKSVGTFQNVEVYRLITQILGLAVKETDSSDFLVKKVLKK